MNVIAVTPVGVNPEPRSMPDGSSGECLPMESTSVPDPAPLTDRVSMDVRGQIQAILDQLPEAASKLSVTLLSLREGQPTTMQKVQAAAREIDKATSQAADIHSTPKQPATHIVTDQPAFKLGDFLRTGSMELFGFISQSAMVLILVFFLLLAGGSWCD